MRRVIIDTNIWLDIFLARPQFAAFSKVALIACIEDGWDVCIVATSLKDIFYWVAKSRGSERAYEALAMLQRLASLLPVDAVVCEAAMALEKPDYEDGIIAACAQIEKVDAIITRDAEAFADCAAKRFTPYEFAVAAGFREMK